MFFYSIFGTERYPRLLKLLQCIFHDLKCLFMIIQSNNSKEYTS